MQNFDFKRYTPRPKKLLRASLRETKETAGDESDIKQSSLWSHRMPGTHSLFVDTDAANLMVSTLLKACIKKRNGSNWASKRNLALPTLYFDSDLQFELKSRGFSRYKDYPFTIEN